MTLYSFMIGAPILFTPKKSIRETLHFLKLNSETNFYDLGAGTGRSLIIAKKEFGAHTCGFELSPFLFLLAKINLTLNKAKDSKLYLRNFYNRDLGKADVIFCFLTPPAMQKLKEKFEKELKPGVWIASYGFSIPGWEPVKIFHFNNPGKMYIYKSV